MRTGIILLVVAVFLGMIPKVLEPDPKVGRLVSYGAIVVGAIGLLMIVLAALALLGVW